MELSAEDVHTETEEMRLSEDVSYITLCKPLPLVLHAYVWPFVLAYLSLVSVWFSLYGFEESLEVFFLCLAVIAAINIITCLFCVWSVHVRCALTCKKVCTPRSKYSPEAIEL